MLGDIFYWLFNMSVVASLSGAVILLLRRVRRIPRRLIALLWAIPCIRMWVPFGIGGRYGLMSLLNALRSQHGNGLSILFICHDIALVQQFCDRVLVMYKGSIVEQGVPDDVIRNPKDDYTKRLIDSIL